MCRRSQWVLARDERRTAEGGSRDVVLIDEISGVDRILGLDQGMRPFRELVLQGAEVVQVAAHGLPGGAHQALNVRGGRGLSVDADQAAALFRGGHGVEHLIGQGGAAEDG
jgi:hypothetical protein